MYRFLFSSQFPNIEIKWDYLAFVMFIIQIYSKAEDEKKLKCLAK
jgi:hypothetical protein